MGKKVLVLGAGAVGIAMASAMVAGGMDVTVFARGVVLENLKNQGMGFTGIFGSKRVTADSFRAIDSLEEEEAFDFIVVSVKTTANAGIGEMLSACPSCFHSETVLILFQNGWGIEAPFEHVVPKERLYHARISIGFEKTSDVVSNITVSTAPMLTGSMYGGNADCVVEIAEAVAAAGIPSRTVEDIAPYIWAKVLFNTTLNTLGAILNMTYGMLGESESARTLMDRMVEETFAVMKGYGYVTLWDSPKAYSELLYDKLIPDGYHHRSSTLQDIQLKRKTEIDFLNGKIVELGRNLGIPTPVHEMVTLLIKSLEEQY